MSGKDLEKDGGRAARPKLGRGLVAAIVCVVVVGAAAALYVMLGSAFKPADPNDLHPLAKAGMAKLQPSPAAPPPFASFVDADGKPVRLADFKGKVLVVNLWATWCAPCVKEMPTLAALQTAYAGKPVKVLAVSVDPAKDALKAKAFIAAHAPLAFYQDASLNLPFAFKPPAQGFPTTILYDRSGVERARMTGDADWSGPDAKAVVDRLLGG